MEVWKALIEISGYVLLLVIIVGTGIVIIGGIVGVAGLAWEQVTDWWRHRANI